MYIYLYKRILNNAVAAERRLDFAGQRIGDIRAVHILAMLLMNPFPHGDFSRLPPG